jgi:hypothetical protein
MDRDPTLVHSGESIKEQRLLAADSVSSTISAVFDPHPPTTMPSKSANATKGSKAPAHSAVRIPVSETSAFPLSQAINTDADQYQRVDSNRTSRSSERDELVSCGPLACCTKS